MNIPLNIIIVDDHEIVRDGIHAILDDIDNIDIIAEAANGKELFECLKFYNPDIIILDIELPDMSGTEITKIIKQNTPNIKILIFSGKSSDETVFEVLELGANGYVTKNSMRAELINAINIVGAGSEYLCNSLSNGMLVKYISRNKNRIEENLLGIDSLSQREIDVLKLICDGLSYKDIGEKLFLSPRTIETHKNNMLEKLNLKSIIDLVKFAIKAKIVNL